MAKKVMSHHTRITSLDVLRGFAILGIPLMNIQSFSMVSQAYLNPTAYGDLSGLNLATWILSHLVADHKFMTIFSLMFGTSTLMIIDNAERKGLPAAAFHYRRNFWLLVIGMLHAYLIWYGDILVPYAITAFLIYPLRNLSPGKLVILGLVIFSVSSLSDLYQGIALLHQPEEVIRQWSGGWKPDATQIEREVNAYRGNYREQLEQRFHTTLFLQTEYFIGHYFWRILGLMLLGMSLYRSGFITSKMTPMIYRRTLLFGGITGLALVTGGMLFNFHHGWELQYSMLLGSQFNYWGSLGMSLSYMSGVILLSKHPRLALITGKLAAVGRMALSNYLLQSLFLAAIFYGLGLFGRVERFYQLLIVVLIWVVQPLVSQWWLKYFQYGPFEWAWRSLTLQSRVKMRKEVGTKP